MSRNWEEPTKRIFSGEDLEVFRSSIAYNKIHQTMMLLVLKVQGNDVVSNVLDLNLVTKKSTVQKIDPPVQESTDSKDDRPSNYVGVLRILHHANVLIDETPPVEGPTRFGNFNCRVWHDKLNSDIDEWFMQNLEYDDPKYIIEAKYYFLNSFGSKIRLDFGTGHELSFIAFVGSLIDLKILDLDQLSGQDILELFANYYDVARKLILVYNLEPAGSHGVWGLDDHFHFIYILGASEFVNNKLAPPVQQVLQSSNISYLKSTNLYVNAIAFIHKIKFGPFNEHSPIIYDIHTSVTLWEKVLKGLLKMYEVEVLGKFPVVQHFWFGEVLYPWKDISGKDLPVKEVTDEPHVIPIPTAIRTTKTNISMTPAPWANRR
jgi:serine/threonine-protein phosphatase 2A activator